MCSNGAGGYTTLRTQETCDDTMCTCNEETIAMVYVVSDFMFIVEPHQVPRNLTERVTDYIVSKWTNTKGVEQDKVDKLYQ